MRRKRHCLAKRRHSELRRFAGAPLRRFLAKCRSRYHFSIWHMIKRRARLTGETGCGVRKGPGIGRETRGERSDVRSCAGFSDACITKASTRSHDRRPRSAKARKKTYRAIGHFMFEFSQTEYTIRHYLAEEIGLNEEHFAAVVESYDVGALCTVAIEVFTKARAEEN